MTARQIIVIMRCMLILLWVPTTAWAAQVPLSDTLRSIDIATIAVVFALSSLAGATALVLRIEKELRPTAEGEPPRKLPRPWLFSTAHMLGSWQAGVLALAVSEGMEINNWAKLVLIICAGFSGAKFIEWITEKYLSKILPPGNTP